MFGMNKIAMRDMEQVGDLANRIFFVFIEPAVSVSDTPEIGH